MMTNIHMFTIYFNLVHEKHPHIAFPVVQVTPYSVKVFCNCNLCRPVCSIRELMGVKGRREGGNPYCAWRPVTLGTDYRHKGFGSVVVEAFDGGFFGVGMMVEAFKQMGTVAYARTG